MPTTAAILAGGRGTRLRPILADRPKALAVVGSKPVIDHQLQWLRRQGVERVVLLTGHLGEKLREHCGDGGRWRLKLLYSHEAEPKGTAGALRLARDLLPRTFWVVNGDTLIDLPLGPPWSWHHQHGGPVTIVMSLEPAEAPVDGEGDYGRALVDASGLVRAFKEKGSAGRGGAPDPSDKVCVNAGVYLLDRRVVDLVPPDRFCSLEDDIFPGLLGRLRAFVTTEPFYDIGTPARYRLACASWRNVHDLPEQGPPPR